MCPVSLCRAIPLQEGGLPQVRLPVLENVIRSYDLVCRTASFLLRMICRDIGTKFGYKVVTCAVKGNRNDLLCLHACIKRSRGIAYQHAANIQKGLTELRATVCLCLAQNDSEYCARACMDLVCRCVLQVPSVGVRWATGGPTMGHLIFLLEDDLKRNREAS